MISSLSGIPFLIMSKNTLKSMAVIPDEVHVVNPYNNHVRQITGPYISQPVYTTATHVNTNHDYTTPISTSVQIVQYSSSSSARYQMRDPQIYPSASASASASVSASTPAVQPPDYQHQETSQNNTNVRHEAQSGSDPARVVRGDETSSNQNPLVAALSPTSPGVMSSSTIPTVAIPTATAVQFSTNGPGVSGQTDRRNYGVSSNGLAAEPVAIPVITASTSSEYTDSNVNRV
eukprot:CAMPEP_0182432828 /NCGR_PEP_ID=MMETSP1167-20130531/59169_1 /TAXON_ID=2988 /ORGANISM="Mallomonas Sp, Strain CCMP3275" /LENGTH=232 /DNA_ID=CAMNT_0024620805 /DNA_START=595 /DNA_END=1293 /DNA_ORIENTATION=-